MKKHSEDYKIVSVITVFALACAMVFLIIGGLQHAINTSPSEPDDAYVNGINHAGADQ